MGRPLRFALQPLLEHYQARELGARIQLTVAQRAFADVARDARHLFEELKAGGDALARPQLRSSDVHLHGSALDHLHGAILFNRQSALACQTEIDRLRVPFLEAAKNRTALERLRARRAKRHAAREQVLEERRIDESNSSLREALRCRRSGTWT